jgi:DNA-binding ferritin-like protein
VYTQASRPVALGRARPKRTTSIKISSFIELRDDNKQLVARTRETHDLCDEHGDVATASLLEVWIDEAERRTWFLFEATRADR